MGYCPIDFEAMEAMTLIVPIFNEEANILRVWAQVDEYRKKSNLQIYTLFVDDGSTDSSLDLIREVCREDPSCGYLSFLQNRGLSAAIKAGVDHAQSRWVGYIDGDLQTAPLDLLKFETFLYFYDLVTGERRQRQDSYGKKLSSSFANWFRNLFLKDGISDTGCPLKVFDREFFLKIPYFNGFHRFFPALTQIYGGSVKVIPVQHFPRVQGKSKFNAWNRMIQPLLDMLLVWRLKKRRIHYAVKESKVAQLALIHE